MSLRSLARAAAIAALIAPLAGPALAGPSKKERPRRPELVQTKLRAPGGTTQDGETCNASNENGVSLIDCAEALKATCDVAGGGMSSEPGGGDHCEVQ